MAQTYQSDDQKLVTIQSFMDEAGGLASFREFDPFGERHGSWQRTMHTWSEADGLDRYVIAALTSLEEGDEIAVMERDREDELETDSANDVDRLADFPAAAPRISGRSSMLSVHSKLISQIRRDGVIPFG